MPDFLSLGQIKGLAYQHDWQKQIEGLYQRESYAAQQQALAEEKARHYSSVLARPSNIRSEYNSRRLDKFYSEKLNEIGGFVTKNPGFERDVGLMAKFNELASSIQNNDIVREELQVQEEFELLKSNRGSLPEAKFNMEMERYLAYINQDPDISDQQKADPYFFNKFLVTDPMDIVNKAASKVALTLRELQYQGQTVLGERFHRESLNDVTWNYYNVEDNKFAIDGHFKQLSDEEKGRHDGNPYLWFKNAVSATEDRRFITSTYDKRAGDRAPFEDISPAYNHVYRHLMQDNPGAASNAHNIAFTMFGEPNSNQSISDLNESGNLYVFRGRNETNRFNIPNGVFTSKPGGGTVRVIDGKYYTTVAVTTTLPYSQTQELHPNAQPWTGDEALTIDQYLTKAGFTKAMEVEPSSVRIGISMQDVNRQGTRYTGTILVPMNFNEETTERFNKNAAIGGIEQLKAIDPTRDKQALTYLGFRDYLAGLGDNNPVKDAEGVIPVKVDIDNVQMWGAAAKKGNRYFIITTTADGQLLAPQYISKEQYDQYRRQSSGR